MRIATGITSELLEAVITRSQIGEARFMASGINQLHE